MSVFFYVKHLSLYSASKPTVSNEQRQYVVFAFRQISFNCCIMCAWSATSDVCEEGPPGGRNSVVVLLLFLAPARTKLATVCKVGMAFVLLLLKSLLACCSASDFVFTHFSVRCLLSVTCTRGPCLNRSTDLHAIWQQHFCVPMTHCVRWGQ